MLRTSILISLAGLTLLAGCNFSRGPTLTQPPVSISLLASATTATLGQKVTVTANVYDQSNQGVSWTISPVNFGQLINQTWSAQTSTATVTYSAPVNFASSTTVTITATSLTNSSVSSSVAIALTGIAVLIETFQGLPAAPQTLNPGDQLSLTGTVLNDVSNSGVTWSLSPANGGGSISFSNHFFATYMAPANVSAPTTATITASSVKNPAATTNLQITVMPSGGGSNVAMLNVNGGPVPGQVHSNGLFTALTICNPGSTSASFPVCQTLDGILVDTGSYGLRILQSQIPLLKLPTLTDEFSNTLENCAAWPDGSFLWGPVATADVYIAGEGALAVPIQVISSVANIVPDSCSNGGSVANTAQLLGANGILGIGPEPTDCTLSGVNYCDGSTSSTPPNVYYACPSTGCSGTEPPVLVAAIRQVSNVVSNFFFSSDTNGVIVALPAVSDPQPSTTGTMIFGIGTASNNHLANATVLTLDANNNFTTVFNGQTFDKSSIDSGTNALLFNASLPKCVVHTKFYCPVSTTEFKATAKGAAQGEAVVNFVVGNADELFSGHGEDSVFGTLAGPQEMSGSCGGSVSCTFDWGLPFFYGRTVYSAIDGQNVPPQAPKAPWWAF